MIKQDETLTLLEFGHGDIGVGGVSHGNIGVVIFSIKNQKRLVLIQKPGRLFLNLRMNSSGTSQSTCRASIEELTYER